MTKGEGAVLDAALDRNTELMHDNLSLQKRCVIYELIIGVLSVSKLVQRLNFIKKCNQVRHR